MVSDVRIATNAQWQTAEKWQACSRIGQEHCDYPDCDYCDHCCFDVVSEALQGRKAAGELCVVAELS